ncbi:MAG: VCBS repeat-containing protein [Planctomycetales bacterium]|nr:VCBS repeat-containing protein [Planctomycetales bacterium]MCA9167011.1 VCBS repeat-containing protein [Planctomycetales bacterium]
MSSGSRRSFAYQDLNVSLETAAMQRGQATARRRHRFEFLESRLALTAPTFDVHTLGAYGIRNVAFVDFDGDGRNEIIQQTDDRVIISRVPEVLGTSLPLVRTTYGSAFDVGDIDGDGQLDLATNRSPIPTSVKILLLRDFDQDGDLDLVTAHEDCSAADEVCSSVVATQANLGNGDGQFARPVNIDIFSDVSHLVAQDLDSDGLLDLLAVRDECDLMDGSCDVSLVWMKNAGDHFQRSAVLLDFPWQVASLSFADFDLDGERDIVMMSMGGALAWARKAADIPAYEPAVTLRAKETIVTDRYYPSPGGVVAGDFDGDGDVDIIDVLNDGTSQIGWFENTVNDPSPTGQLFAPRQAISIGTRYHDRIFAGDLNNDGTLDLAITASRNSNGLHLLINTLSPPPAHVIGDVNGDGVFDSSDLVLVFAAGEFEDNRIGNSSFDEGDWNGDGDFTTSDLVAAFQSGGYTADGEARDAITQPIR